MSLIPDFLSSLKSPEDSSNIGQDFGEPALAGQVSSALDGMYTSCLFFVYELSLLSIW
jgi:hypothetical protein